MNCTHSFANLSRMAYVLIASVTAQAAAAQPSLIGDQIFADRINAEASGGPFSYCQDVLGSGPEGCSLTVNDGDSDRFALTGGNNFYVNVEASQIRFDLGPEFGGGGPFDEHLVVFSDLDFRDPVFPGINHIISGVTFETDLIGMDASRIKFSDHGVTVNYADINYPGGQYLILSLATSPVPEPTTAAFTLATALCLGMSRSHFNSAKRPHTRRLRFS